MVIGHVHYFYPQAVHVQFPHTGGSDMSHQIGDILFQLFAIYGLPDDSHTFQGGYDFIDILPVDAEQQFAQLHQPIVGKGSHLAKVDKGYPVFVQNQNIARVGVGLKETVQDYLGQKGFRTQA